MSTGARIFLAENRALAQSHSFRTYKTDVSSCIHSIHDETLKAGNQTSHVAEKDCSVLVIPIVGEVSCLVGVNNPERVDVGEFMIFPVLAGQEFLFLNGYTEELISYLHVWIEKINIVSTKSKFTFEGKQNELVELLHSESMQIKIGEFQGRVDHTLVLAETTTSVFSFVIEGAFEFHERLLQPRDGLLVQGQTQIEFEALSNDAIILVISHYPMKL